RDLEPICTWIDSIPATIDLTLLGIITHNVTQYPDPPAIYTWDGHWICQELDSIAAQIAIGLVSTGCRPNSVISICFEKSRWTPVAMLVVMKAGCASVLLGTTLPLSRLEAIVREVNPPVILLSL
ncbi:hypothetical protein BKA66DRAFT_368452, partial [Pyrenochaeta sp. MPI-SDFR-AT-0127]